MATLQQQRKAIADGMASSRAATGQAERDAAGKAMIEQRTGKAVADDINSLARPVSTRKTLKPLQPVGALLPARGRGVYKKPAATSGGIAGPLVEDRIISNGKQVPDREYWPAGMTSSDGLFILPAIKTLNLTDANGESVQIMLANPEGTIE